MLKTVSIPPKKLTREQIITEGGIPAEIFDYVDKALQDPETLVGLKGVSYWYPMAYDTARDIKFGTGAEVLFTMSTGEIRVGWAPRKEWKNIFTGPLTLKSARDAITMIQEFIAISNDVLEAYSKLACLED